MCSSRCDSEVDIACLIISILSRKELIYRGFSCLLTSRLSPSHSYYSLYCCCCLLNNSFTEIYSHTLQFTHLKVYNSVTFSIFTDGCNHHHNQF